MSYRVFFTCVLIFLSGAARADSFVDPAQVRSDVHEFLATQLQNEYSGINREDIEITVANLDTRLKLRECQDTLRHTITSPRPYGSNLSVKVNCDGATPWTIYVPARIDTYAQIAVMANSVERGTILTLQDVTLTRMNTAQAGYGHIIDLQRIVGMELKRRLQAGEAVRLSHLKAPQVVRKGDRVTIEASGAGVSVVTAGRALANGQLGEQIQVRNEKSDRVVDGEVIAPGKVRISL